MNGLGSVFQEVTAMSWQGAWLVLLLVAARFLLRRQIAPAMLFAGWLVVAVVLLMPLRLPVPWDPLGLGRTAKMRTPITAPTVVIQEQEVSDPMTKPAWPIQALGPVDADAAARFRAEAVNFDVFDVSVSTTRNFIGDLALVWLAGMAVLLSLRGFALLRFHGRLQGTRLPVDGALEQAVRASCAELGLTQMPAVMVTPMVGTPALFGLFRPRLLFPAGFSARLTKEELCWVVRHELGHLQRHDLPAQALLQLACAVHWFNPLVWLAARLARHDCELACDDHVLRRARAEDGADYGRTLIKVLGRTVGPSRLPAAVGIVEGKRQLLKRITMIAGYRRGNLRPVLVGVVLLAGFVFVGYTSPEAPAEKSAAQPVAEPGSHIKLPESDPEPHPAREARKAESEVQADALRIEARAVGEVGGVPVAFIDIDGEPSLVTLNSRFQGFSVIFIDVTRREVVLARSGRPGRVLAVTNPRPIAFPILTEQHIRTLLDSPDYRGDLSAWDRRIPSAVLMAWQKIDRDVREQILLNYLQSGYVMSYFFTPGGLHGSPRRLFDDRLRQRQEERRTAFLNSLTPEQKEAYAGGAQMAIRFTATKEEQETQAAAARTLQARQAEVIASLTPQQRALYEIWQGRQLHPVLPERR